MILIRELLTYLLERPTLSEAKSFGHLVESISLIEREQRCSKAWLPHRNHCKNFITNQLINAKHFNSVLVLGSGPHHEIPIEILSQKFTKVVLVDIVHLKGIKKSVQHLGNVEFVEHEISEIEQLLKTQNKLIAKRPVAFTELDWGLVLSVNIMSQLPIHLDSYIKKKLKNKFKKEDIDQYLKDVTTNHLRYLQSFKCPALLITDTETSYYDRQEVLLQKDLNYSHLELPKSLDEWLWNVAPIPEFDKKIAMKMQVSAFVINTLNSH